LGETPICGRVGLDAKATPAQFLFKVIGVAECDSVISADIDKYSVSFPVKQEFVDETILSVLAVITSVRSSGVNTDITKLIPIKYSPEIQ